MARKARLLPDKRHASSSRASTGALPQDLLAKAVQRLRSTACIYAFVYFMAGFFPALLFAEDRAQLFGSVARWAPGTLAIGVALGVAALVGRVPPATAIAIGLFFEVASSYGIAVAEFAADPLVLDAASRWVGLSWVAPWVLIFTIVVPAKPRLAVIAALASLSAVPAMAALSFAIHPVPFTPNAARFFFWFVFPYLLIVLMAYSGSRNVYGLGGEVVRARELGSYRLVEPLAQGGMGEVWRADHQMLARPAAIKLIRPSLESRSDSDGPAGVRRRFEREAQVTARLRSPHTVELFDFGMADDGSFYYAMELLDGIDAETLVKRFGPVPAARAIHILVQVCHSLSEAHSYDLVHRDIKPANIFLCRYGGEYDFVKVLDFGIVKTSPSTTETGATLTLENGVTGTPAFIAPEQALGKPVDSRADIYAAGCVAYWLLTGELVFTAATPVGMMVQHAQTPPAPPSARTEMPVPAALERLVLECLAKDPADRPQTAKELSRRLAQVGGAGDWTEANAADWWSLHQPAAS
jgi:tRNA A-37 threonylcarbamoyl transferase component Bud32